MQNAIGVRSVLGDACGTEIEEALDNEGVGWGDRATELAKVVDTLRRGSGALEGIKAQPNRDVRVAIWEDIWVGVASRCSSSSTISEVSELDDDIYNETAEQRALTCDCACLMSHQQEVSNSIEMTYKWVLYRYVFYNRVQSKCIRRNGSNRSCR